VINILLFAHLQEAIREESIAIQRTEITVADLKKVIENEYELNLDNIMVAVNEEFVEEDFIIKEGNTVALIPPVSGG
jgi:molybdopterin synthase sulfur carrier subunit